MAKQNVTFIERHLEKMILGVCGAILLAVVAMYLIQSPNTVDVNGEDLGPVQFYARLREAADTALNNMRRVDFQPAETELARVKQIIDRLNMGLASGSEVPEQFRVAFVMPSPPVPDLESGPFRKIELAQILPPSKPVTGPKSAGRSLALLPPPTIISADTTGAAPPQPSVNPLIQPQPEPVYWITLASLIDRKAQREKFEANGYHEIRKSLILVGIEARRQMLLPNGEWGPDEIVKGYSPVEVTILPMVTLERGENGQMFVPSEQNMALEQFRGKVSSYDQHQEPMFLRPAFQQELIRHGGDWWAWWVPRELPGLDADLGEDYGVAYAEDELLFRSQPGMTGRPSTPRPGGMDAGGMEPRAPARGFDRDTPRGLPAGRGGRAPATPAAPSAGESDPMAARRVMEFNKKADEALAKRDFLQVEKYLQAIATMQGAPEPLKQQAIRMLEEHKEAIAQAYKDEEARIERLAREKQMNFGPNLDPIWFTDTTVVPGKTYRYQLRLLALNAYAGEPGVWYLKDIEDARRVVLPGSWSEWSDPVTALPDKQLFAHQMADDNSVVVDLWQWMRDRDGTAKWIGGSTKIAVGEPVVYKSARTEISYGATIASVEPNRSYRRRLSNRDGTVSYGDPEQTHAVVLVNGLGEPEEHLIAQDRERLSNFRSEKAEEERLRQQLQHVQPQTVQRAGLLGGPMQIPTMMDRGPHIGTPMPGGAAPGRGGGRFGGGVRPDGGT